MRFSGPCLRSRQAASFRLDQTFRDEPSLEAGKAQVKRWLHDYQRSMGKGSMRYLASWEHGSKRGRLHVHMLICLSPEVALGATVKAFRASARRQFGVNTARLLKRPGRPMSPQAAEKAAYAVKETVAYAVKDIGKAKRPPLKRDAQGNVLKGKDGRALREQVRQFTRSNGWGKSAVQAMLDRSPLVSALLAPNLSAEGLALADAVCRAAGLGPLPDGPDENPFSVSPPVLRVIHAAGRRLWVPVR